MWERGAVLMSVGSFGRVRIDRGKLWGKPGPGGASRPEPTEGLEMLQEMEITYNILGH